MRYHLVPVSMAIIKKSQIINAGEDVEERQPSHTVGKLVQPLWRTVWKFLKKPKIELPCACMLRCVWFFATLWTVACQVPLSMGFSRQEYWNGLPFPSPGDFPDPQIELVSPESHALTDVSFTTEPLFHWMQTSWQQRLLDYIMFSVLHSQCRA